MILSVSPVEGVWLVANLIALVLTLSALVGALSDQAAVHALNGKARELAATGQVRREALRAIVQVLLVFVVIPGLFVDRDVPLTPTVTALMAVPLVLLLSSILDARDRRRMTVLATAEVIDHRNAILDRIEEAITENTEISRAASELASAAYQEANTVNKKLEAQGREILEGHKG